MSEESIVASKSPQARTPNKTARPAARRASKAAAQPVAARQPQRSGVGRQAVDDPEQYCDVARRFTPSIGTHPPLSTKRLRIAKAKRFDCQKVEARLAQAPSAIILESPPSIVSVEAVK